MTVLLDSRYVALRSPPNAGVLGVVADVFLLLLLIASYIPQYIRIRKLRSTHGISFYFVLLRSIYATASLSNLLMLAPVFWNVQKCRTTYSPGRCFSENLVVWQMAADWVFSQAIPQSNHRPSSSSSEDGVGQIPVREAARNMAAGVTIAVLVIYLFLLGPSIGFVTSYPIRDPGYYILLQTWSFVLIGASCLLVIISFPTQIYHTYALKRTGALSIQALAIQVPIYILQAVSLATWFELNKNSNFLALYLGAYNAWFNILLSSFWECILLVTSMCYIYQTRKLHGRASDTVGHQNADESGDYLPDERTHLLRGESSSFTAR
ncbi:hypothetical protein PAAG_00759 [Paracoccidioides lutzii Pb01]|uniref:PQ loop repeat protein n=1 Tax=Paracoccidioides lutzii (strain ATCC MYA-826 / Pb01) TaxID=502779 RepID=C1GQG4_PARBA|nr:hypothetical protein PAAG_00759 [Paracoccidioides lutzii Pb01]EEH37838.2 hypothetical protein PAAG_00759 [Paracoccidioides lutzii Pb01]